MYLIITLFLNRILCEKNKSHIRVHGEFVQVVVLVKGIVLSQVDEFLQGLVDEDDADE